MEFGSTDVAAVLSATGGADTSIIARLLLAVGLDPANPSLAAMLNRLWEIALANINIANSLALAGAIFYVITLLMRTIVPLRIFGIIGDALFIGYGMLANSISTFFLYLLMLPINSVRLYQMLKLVDKARRSAEGDLSMSWLEPYMVQRRYRKNDVLFRKGERANEMFMVVSGKFLVTELAMELLAGHIFGELGFLSPSRHRTQTIECVEDGQVLSITYDKLLELYFQNPEFGYYFLRLSSERLLEDVARLERIIEVNKDVIAQAEAARQAKKNSPDRADGQTGRASDGQVLDGVR
jgi:CRP-like cAMP-binding protein